MSSTPPGLAPDALAAADRLTQSRERLRHALHDPAGAARAGAAGGQPASDWLKRLAGLPGAAVLLDGLHLWWARHPWRVYILLAEDAAKILVKPLARQHPVALLLGAAVLGVALVRSAGLLGVALRWVRPLRWLWRSGAATALLAGLLPQLMSHGAHATQQRRPAAQPPAHNPSTSQTAPSSRF